MATRKPKAPRLPTGPAPYVGMTVRFRDKGGRRFGGEPVTAAIVTQAFEDRSVNLVVLPNGHGESYFAAAVPLDPALDAAGDARGWSWTLSPAPPAV